MPPRAAVILLAALTLAACEQERVVSVKGGLSGLGKLPGAASNIPESAYEKPTDGDRFQKLLDKDQPGQPVEGKPLRRQLDNGEIYLISRSPRELISHLYDTLQNDERALLESQVLAERTKRAYRAAGKPPADAADWIFRNRKWIEDLIAAMPAGEQTPGVFMKPLGDNAFRLTLNGSELLDLRYKALEVVIEEGRFRLLMIR